MTASAESVAVIHPAVELAVCVGVGGSQPRWDEQTLLIVTLEPSVQLSRE
jgi:hypothetical protein